ncbi:MAG: N-6 DNA methylase [Propionibacteriaceae bacterium]|jgi:hypothetical protein|nr:N-6 DNA methylase [Propionibacteriaceae bacterium]
MVLKDSAVADFVARWHGRGNEKQETQKFWLELLQDVLHLPNAIRETEFEHPTSGGGYIDVLIPRARFLAEQKSLGINLDKPEVRQGVPVTPLEQALRYADYLPFSQKPRFICTCNFANFRIYDLEQDPRGAKGPLDEFALDDLANHISTLTQVFGESNDRIHVQAKLSEQAGVLVANLHKALAACYENPDDLDEHHALAMLTVRLVFCLYAEDAGLFPDHAFSELMRHTRHTELRAKLRDLFLTLDTEESQRDKYLEPELARLPYVNGGLFRERIDIPPLTFEIKNAIVEAGLDFNWRGISPVIFGSLMEETLSHDQRRAGGMHYTTVKNIHRVIDPLFLDDLRAELVSIERENLNGKARALKLRAFQNKLGSLRFLDPACGSGNFLTETFLCLRQLENQAIEDMLHGQSFLDFGGEDSLIKVHIDQMYGIEINDFAVNVARTALWIAEQQAQDDTEAIALTTLSHLPLKDSANIVCANALRTDWNDVLPANQCSYIMGNPPFIGAWLMTDEQRDDMKLVWGKQYDGYLDFATAWYCKASGYLANTPGSAFALVSTNSITQGQPVPALFKPLFAEGWRIRFAHRTFAWDAQSSDMAHVHVVIIGMDKEHEPKPALFTCATINSEPAVVEADNINAYLIDGPDLFVEKRMNLLSAMLTPARFGSKPTDGGNLIIESGAYETAMADPIAAKYVRPFRMGNELINGIDRWCLWLKDSMPSERTASHFIRTRVEAVRAFRQASKKLATQKKAATSYLFDEDHQPSTQFLAIPRVFSGNRRWATCDWYTQDIIAADSVFTCIDPDSFAFAIVSSSMFIAWQRAVGGRLKSDFRFSNTLVWNNLPLPPVSDDLRQSIIDAGKHILEIRSRYPGESLANLYDMRAGMQPDLIEAHEQLDVVVDRAFGAKRRLHSDDDRLALLFSNYQDMASGSREAE